MAGHSLWDHKELEEESEEPEIRDENQSSNCQHSLDHRENKGIAEKYLILLH